MKIALAQIAPFPGQLDHNIRTHLDYIQKAAQAGADAVFFPELSLTGYEPTLAAQLATTPEDSLFQPLQTASNELGIVIGAGMPTRAAESIHISMLLFQPRQKVQVYHKQYLHEDELPFFAPGPSTDLLRLRATNIGLAICYESLQPRHLNASLQKGAQIYLASVAKSQRGIDKAMAYFPAAAKKHGVPILMVNNLGPCDNFVGAGQSSAWDREGRLIQQLKPDEQGMLLFSE